MAAESINATMLDNSTHENQTKEPFWTFTESTSISIILSISSVLTVVGNSMVITVILRYPVMRTRTNLFLMNLAIADLLVGLLLVPCSIVTLISGGWVLGKVLCSVNGFLNCFCLVTSIHTLMYISVHKCYSLPRSQSDSFKVRQILMMIAATWLWAGVLSTTTVTGMSNVYYKDKTSQCGPTYPHDLLTYIHHALIQTTGIIIPLVTIIVCYCRMVWLIWYHSQSLRINTTLDNSLIVAQQKKIFFTLFMVLACFIICWIPYQAYASYTTIIRDKKHFPGFINPLAYTFGYINSAFNPIIYALRSDSFRQGYKELWCHTKGYFYSEGLSEWDNSVSPASPYNRFTSLFYFGRPSLRSSRNTLNLSRSAISLTRVDSTVSPDYSRKASVRSLPQTDSPDNPRRKFKRNKSLTELMRATPKLSPGHSVIRADGSIVIMKAGKIVSVRKDNSFSRLSSESPTASPTLLLPNNGKDKRRTKGKVNNNKELSTVYSEDDSSSDTDEVFTDFKNQNSPGEYSVRRDCEDKKFSPKKENPLDGEFGNEYHDRVHGQTTSLDKLQSSLTDSADSAFNQIKEKITVNNQTYPNQLPEVSMSDCPVTDRRPDLPVKLSYDYPVLSVLKTDSPETRSNEDISIFSSMSLKPVSDIARLAKSDINLNSKSSSVPKHDKSQNRFFPNSVFSNKVPLSLSDIRLDYRKSPLLERRLKKRGEALLSPL